MNIDTATIQKLRDALLDEGRSGVSTGEPAAVGVVHHQETLERFTPFAETMFLVAMVDGHEDPAEIDALRGAMRVLTANQLADDALTDIYQRCKHDLSVSGLDAYLGRLGANLARDRLDRETAFSLAAAVALADDKVNGAESDLMRSIAEYLGISNSTAKRLLEAL